MLGCARGWGGRFGIHRPLVCCCTVVKFWLWMGTVLAILAIPVLNAVLKLCAGKFHLLLRGAVKCWCPKM